MVIQSIKTATGALLLHLFFLEGNRTAPFSMTEAGAVLVEGGFLACHEQKDIKQEGFTRLLAASSLLYG